MPGLYKIGFTTKDVSERTSQLSKSTGVPTDFECLYHAYFKFFVQPEVVEQMLHREFDSIRVSNKEFFRFESDEIAIAHVATKMLAVCESYLDIDQVYKKVENVICLPDGGAERMFCVMSELSDDHIKQESIIQHVDMMSGDIENLAILRTYGYEDFCYGGLMLWQLGYAKNMYEGFFLYLNGGRFFKLWLEKVSHNISAQFIEHNNKINEGDTLQ